MAKDNTSINEINKRYAINNPIYAYQGGNSYRVYLWWMIE